jgi:hypothetical protein
VGYNSLSRSDAVTVGKAGSETEDAFNWASNWILRGSIGSQADFLTRSVNGGSRFFNWRKSIGYNSLSADCLGCGRMDARSMLVAVRSACTV